MFVILLLLRFCNYIIVITLLLFAYQHIYYYNISLLPIIINIIIPLIIVFLLVPTLPTNNKTISYSSNALRLSALMRDRRSHPLQDAVWLLEYVGRNRGAEHLKLASRNLNLLEYLSLDCAAFLALCAWGLLGAARAGVARMTRGGGWKKKKKGKVE